MDRWIRFAILTAFFCLLYAGRASATTYYIAANGADSNNGTTKATPFLHAPGMTSCSNTCASTIPQPGDSVIFRGGDTWHMANSSASPYSGGGWNWTWSGGSSACNWPSATSSCIYIGVDQTWYTGGSWTRPAFYFDNLPSSSLVASCTYDESASFKGINIGNGSGYPNNNVNYVIMDNFEWYGHCHSQPNPAEMYINMVGTYIAVIDCYFHGWTMTNNPQPDGSTPMDFASIFGGYFGGTGGTGVTHNVIAYDVFDGSDAYCAGNKACSGGPVSVIDAYDFDHNVCRWIANCLNNPYNTYTVHDNLFEDVYQSFDPSAHSAVSSTYGSSLPTGTPIYFYNNMIRNTNTGVVIQRASTSTGNVYIFNNVFWNTQNITNCIQLGNNDNSQMSNFYVVQNTIDADATAGQFCVVRFASGNPQPANGTAYFQNNHFVGYSPATLPSVYNINSGNTVTITDNGSEIFQSESAANAQGYTESDNYQPTSGGATIGAGANLSSSCATFSPDSALCYGTTGGVTNTAGTGTIPTLYVASPPARGSAWDAGAYEFGSASSSQPAAPSDLVATVQ